MDASAVREIGELAIKADEKIYNGRVYVNDSYHVLGAHRPDPVEFTTLDSFCRFITDNPQSIDLMGSIIVIGEDFTVRLLTMPNDVDSKRTVVATARCHSTEKFRFNTKYDSESFVIALKSMFMKDDSEWEQTFNLVRKVQIDEGVELNDDGMSMNVTVRKGISNASVEKGVKPTDLKLRPFRIFPECLQPASRFFMRLSGNKDSGVFVSLHETDGGAWKIEASKIIKAFIDERINTKVEGDEDAVDSIPVYC